MPRCGATFDENIPPLQRGRRKAPGPLSCSRPLSVRATPPQEGIFTEEKSMTTTDSVFQRALSNMLTEIFDGPPGQEAYLLNPGDPGLLRQLDTIEASAASKRFMPLKNDDRCARRSRSFRPLHIEPLGRGRGESLCRR